jgi:hypothetical protein
VVAPSETSAAIPLVPETSTPSAKNRIVPGEAVGESVAVSVTEDPPRVTDVADLLTVTVTARGLMVTSSSVEFD